MAHAAKSVRFTPSAARLLMERLGFAPRALAQEGRNENATLAEAIHILVMGHHQSLLVTRGDEIVGILRLTDVFSAVFQSLATLSESA